MTEYEELALKKIVKAFLIENMYTRINLLSGKYGISNAEISEYIGWESAGFNQKFNRSNDLRISTFIRVYAGLVGLIEEKEEKAGLSAADIPAIRLNELITQDELDAGILFNHISAAAEGRVNFLDRESYVKTFKSMKPFVLMSKNSNRINEREMNVYINYYLELDNKS